MSLIDGLRAPAGASRKIQVGDLVIVYERFDCMKYVTVEAAGKFQNRWGLFLMQEWVGKAYGSKVRSKTGQGWVHLLAPTPELWTIVLRHRTQILYLADIAMVCAQLELRPGCTVLESGTGSGSLTTSLARAVAPTGRVLTFEFHEQRADLAREEFARNGLGELVTVDHRNIEQDGFPEELHGAADAVFLDLPGPWRAVPSAAACLRPDGVFCGFSPCMEQVQRTGSALNSSGFKDIRTFEILLRDFEVGREKEVPALQSLLIAQLQPTQHAAEVRSGKKQKLGGKRAANGGAEASAAELGEPVALVEPIDAAPGDAVVEQGVAGKSSRLSVKPVGTGKGHTGFLTFARKACD